MKNFKFKTIIEIYFLLLIFVWPLAAWYPVINEVAGVSLGIIFLFWWVIPLVLPPEYLE